MEDGSFVRVRMNRSEVKALVDITNLIRPNQLSNFEGERQGLHTIMAKLDRAIKKLDAISKEVKNG